MSDKFTVLDSPEAEAQRSAWLEAQATVQAKDAMAVDSDTEVNENEVADDSYHQSGCDAGRLSDC